MTLTEDDIAATVIGVEFVCSLSSSSSSLKLVTEGGLVGLIVDIYFDTVKLHGLCQRSIDIMQVQPTG